MKSLLKKFSEIALWKQIVVGIILGLIFGIVAPNYVSNVSFIGTIFIQLLKLVLIPLVFFSLLSGICNIGNLQQLRSIGGRILTYFITTSFFGALIGVSLAMILQPGKGVTDLLDTVDASSVEASTYSFVETFASWIPSNIFESLYNFDMVPIIFFTLFLGICLLAVIDKIPNTVVIIQEGNVIFTKMTDYVIRLSPIGIFALVANMVPSLTGGMIEGILLFIITDLLGCAILFVIVFPILIKTLTKLSVIKFYKKIAPAMVVAASTTSSAATLPVSMKIAKEKLGISEKVYSFTLPLGNTCNMNAAAIAQAAVAVFACNLYGLDLTFMDLLQIVIFALVLSIGTAGVKGAPIIMSTILLESLGLPIALVSILSAIWPIVDPANTTCNIVGDLVGTAIVGRQLDEVDMEVYNN